MFVRKPTRSSFIDKAGCTRQFESELSLRSFAQLFPVKEGFTSLLGLLPSGEKRKPLLLVALNRFALRLADHQRSRQRGCAGWDRLGVIATHCDASLSAYTPPLNNQRYNLHHPVDYKDMLLEAQDCYYESLFSKPQQ